MRAGGSLLAILFAIAGCGDPACAPGTVLLTVSFSGASAEADALAVTLSLDGGPPQTRTVMHTPGETSGTIEVDFSSAYPAGQSLAFTVVASAGGTVVGSATQSVSVKGSCDALSLAIDAPPDLSTSDSTAPDLSTPPDLSPSPPQPLCSADHWCWVNPLPQGNGLVQVYGFSASDVWAVGSAGTLMHFDGSRWTRFNATNADLWSVWGVAKDDVWAGGAGVLLHWNGQSWSSIVDENPINDTFVSIWGSSASDVFAAGASATVAHWDGTKVNLVTVGDGSEFFTSISGSSASDVFLLGTQLWHSSGGANFAVAATQPPSGSVPTSIYVDGPGDAWLVGRQIVHLTNGAFQAVSGLTPNSLQSVWGTGASDIWACGRSGTVVHFDGKSWNAGFTPGTSVYLWGGFSSAPNDVWLVGDAGTLLHYDGHLFTSSTSGFVTDLYDVWGASAHDVWTVGAAGAIYHFDGQGWSSVPSGTSNHLYGIWGTGTDDVWTVGGAGTILHWSGAAKGWQAVASGVTFDIASVWGSRSNDVWAVGGIIAPTGSLPSTSNASIVHWDGNSWSGGYTFSSPFVATHLNAVHGGTAPGEVWAVGNSTATSTSNNASLFAHYPGSGTVWTVSTVAAGNDVEDVWAGQYGAFAVGAGQLYSYDLAWSATAAPNQLVPWGLFGFADNDVYVVGTAYGAPSVLHWNGSQWSPQSAGVDGLNKIWGAAPNDLWAVGNGGAILHRAP